MDGEVLNCYREVENTHDPSAVAEAVAVRKDAVTVGHIPLLYPRAIWIWKSTGI